MNRLCLDFLTAADVSLAELAALAAANDCDLISVKLHGAIIRPIDPRLLEDSAERRHLKATCDALGVKIDMLESFSITPEVDLETFRPAMATGAWLGARSANIQVREDEPQRMLDRFAAACAMAADHGMQVYTEMSRRMALKTVAEGVRFLKQASIPNAQLMIDTLHFFRFDQAPETAAEGEGFLGRVQLCDGPPDMALAEQLNEALHERLPPGEGALPLKAFLAAMPDDIVVGLEVPMRSQQERGVTPADRVARVFKATRRLMAEVAAAR